jgi:peptide chain release factor subunit 3
MDDHSVAWSETRWKEIQTNLLPFLNKSGYKDSDVFFVPISGLTGDNILYPVGEKCPWYKGQTLMQILDNLPVETRNPDGPLRIPILDKMKESGVIAHGKIESGMIRVGDKIMISPTGYPAQVGVILDHKNESVMFARPGENVQIKLIHIDDENMINKGDVITGREQQMPVTMLFEAEVELFELLDYKPIVSKGYTCMMHCHTFADECVIKDIISCQEKNNTSGNFETKEAPKFVKSFTTCRVRITTRNPIAIEKFETIPQLGRFTLRDEGKTIAAGKILKYKPHTVPPPIIVTGTAGVASAAPAKDKNEVLMFDLESGKTGKADKPLETTAEQDEVEEDKE